MLLPRFCVVKNGPACCKTRLARRSRSCEALVPLGSVRNPAQTSTRRPAFLAGSAIDWRFATGWVVCETRKMSPSRRASPFNATLVQRCWRTGCASPLVRF